MDSYPRDFPFGIMDVVELLHLQIRRRQANSVYVDCPFCNDRRGKMNVNYVKNVWRCNYCGEHGGMLALYAKLNSTTNSDAYREICDILQTDPPWGYEAEKKHAGCAGVSNGEPRAVSTLPGMTQQAGTKDLEEVPQSQRASDQEIHQTYSLLFEMLSLTDQHRRHLRSPKRGLTDEQIDSLGYKSTPPAFLCRSLTERLLARGCTVQGVPGFYQLESGNWSAKFNRRTAGILIPARGIDGLICGIQILLDVPLRDKNDPPDKAGAKYIWFSSSTKNMGTTSGSPVHFVGNPFARTVYVTEGLLKADIAHLLMNLSFMAIAGANNVSRLDLLFALLAQHGTELIVEAFDIDKYSNKAISQGASKIYLMARKHGMNCRRLTWNPNYKGVDDWQLALRRKEMQEKEEESMTFKTRYLSGLCNMDDINRNIEIWHKMPENGVGLTAYLGLAEDEYAVFLRNGQDELEKLLDTQRRERHFRIYQLSFETEPTIPFAFLGIEALHKAGFNQPPAAKYRLVYEGSISVPRVLPDDEILQLLFIRYSTPQEGYSERCLAVSDVMELYDEEQRLYFYRDMDTFVPCRFSPAFAKPMSEKQGNNG
ncbi:DNA primase [Lacrimispora amygdalina]|uniref:DNA primase n=1 Tax=Lacrimispora amygdalina TaxID=253257 RepID=A0A3E2N902_9FIRM|nr:YodL domain-containing protein [Clostridium indicum]RFZ77489.1 DNA primase [Clostridium indicum]